MENKSNNADVNADPSPGVLTECSFDLNLQNKGLKTIVENEMK